MKDDPRDAEANWATSVQLNRLLFVYFLADQGFLPGGVERLAAALEAGNFHAWFNTLALKALGSNGARPSGCEDIPYLNGGLFVLHETEQGRDLTLPDSHYKEWLDFLRSFRWTLSENEGVNTISPHILGYLFERYINQKQMGAYYTKEDVTGYICRSTVIPRLFDKIAESRGKSVHLDIGALSDEGNRRYIFPSVKQRAYLPTETPYEYQRRQERLRRLQEADLHTVDDFVTHNLNLELLAEDWLATRKDPAELLAAYDALQSITILDPTVGSGAFLLAALEILAPLYDFALRRMEAMVKEAGEATPLVNWAGELNLEAAFDQKVLADPAESETISAMRDRLAEVAKHENSGYFIRKRILLNNLYGVDIMPEAVEICKLRLYLALVSSANPGAKLEPLPDVDLNYRAGNALVGFATLQEIQEHFNPKGTLGLEFGEERLIRASVKKIQEINRRQEAGEVPHELIEEVEEQRRAAVLGLDRQQAEMRGCVFDAEFLRSHRPFHWLAEYPTVILERGGFDCIVGNPPWKTHQAKTDGYAVTGFTAAQGLNNLYGYVVERSTQVASGNIGIIVPLSVTSSAKALPIQQLLADRRTLVISSFPRRPTSIFEGVEMPCSIIISLRGEGQTVMASAVRHFAADERPQIIESLAFSASRSFAHPYRIAKTGDQLASEILAKLFHEARFLNSLLTNKDGYQLEYQEACRYWVKAHRFVPQFVRNGIPQLPAHGRRLLFQTPQGAAFGCCLLNSSLFYFAYKCLGDTEHINDELVKAIDASGSVDLLLFEPLADAFERALKGSSTPKIISTKQGHKIEYDEIDASQCKSIIDEIDRVLARHYGLTEEELDFIINYDIKYRMGRAEEVE